MEKHQLIIPPSDKHPFDLKTIKTLGQDFRWRKLRDGWYSVVLDGNLIHMRQNDRGVEYESDSGANLNELLYSYFRLDDDIDAIYDYISSRCERVGELAREYRSQRILRQPDRWECMVAYICSAPNSVQNISKSVESMACRIGKPLELNGETRHAFPTPEMVLAAGVGPLEELRLGLDRHSKIIAAAKRVVAGELDLHSLAKPDVCYAEAKRQLMQKCSARRKVANGIADKVANCIALFSLDKMEAFPVDRHIRNALQGCGRSSPRNLFDRNIGEQEALQGCECSPPPSSETAIVKWAQERFGNYAGYANQLLFKGAWDESKQSRRKEKGSNPQLL